MIRARGFEAESVGAAVVFTAAVTLAVSLLLVATPRPLGPVPVPLLPVMTVYFWTLVRPSLMPAPVVFLVGLALDLLTWTPLGFWALGLLAASGAARVLRPYVAGADFWQRLAGIAAATAVVAAAALIALGASARPIPASWLQLVQLILTIVTYPVVEAILSGLARVAGMGRGRS